MPMSSSKTMSPMHRTSGSFPCIPLPAKKSPEAQTMPEEPFPARYGSTEMFPACRLNNKKTSESAPETAETVPLSDHLYQTVFFRSSSKQDRKSEERRPVRPYVPQPPHAYAPYHCRMQAGSETVQTHISPEDTMPTFRYRHRT